MLKLPGGAASRIPVSYAKRFITSVIDVARTEVYYPSKSFCRQLQRLGSRDSSLEAAVSDLAAEMQLQVNLFVAEECV